MPRLFRKVAIQPFLSEHKGRLLDSFVEVRGALFFCSIDVRKIQQCSQNWSSWQVDICKRNRIGSQLRPRKRLKLPAGLVQEEGRFCIRKRLRSEELSGSSYCFNCNRIGTKGEKRFDERNVLHRNPGPEICDTIQCAKDF